MGASTKSGAGRGLLPRLPLRLLPCLLRVLLPQRIVPEWRQALLGCANAQALPPEGAPPGDCYFAETLHAYLGACPPVHAA